MKGLVEINAITFIHRSHDNNVVKVFKEGTVKMNLKIRLFSIAVEEPMFIGN